MKVYMTNNKEVYDNLRSMLSGLAFFRHTESEFFIKTPKNPAIEKFLELGLLSVYEEKEIINP